MTVTLLAAGSPDPRHEHEVRLLAGRLKVAGMATGVAFLEHTEPTASSAALRLREDAVPSAKVVPLFVAASWRARTDVTAAVRTITATANRTTVIQCSPLGVHPLLLAAVGELVAAWGPSRTGRATGLILATAGIRDPRTRQALDALCATHGPLLAAAHGLTGLRVAHLDGGRPIWPVQTLLRRIDRCHEFIVVPITLTAGPARDRVFHAANRVDLPVVPGSLAQTRAIADLVALRVREAAAGPLALPGSGAERIPSRA
jgi:sirohydrochlorin ferrochelatase